MTNEPGKQPNLSGPFSDEADQYRQVYLDESEEELDSLVEAILKLEADPQHAESLHKAFRMLHSLKGSSGMLGFEVVGNFAHELEDRFERYRSGKAVLDRSTTTLASSTGSQSISADCWRIRKICPTGRKFGSGRKFWNSMSQRCMTARANTSGQW